MFAAGLAFSFSRSQPKKYLATASLVFKDLSEDFAVVGVPGGSSESPASRVSREAQTLLRTQVLEDAARTLRPRVSIADLRRRVQVEPDATAGLVNINATAPTGADAAAAANAVARAAVARETRDVRERFSLGARDLQRRYRLLTAQDRSDPSTRATYKERISRLDSLAAVASPVETAEIAQVPSSPSSPNPVRAGIVAGFLGGFIGVGIALLRSRLDRRLRAVPDIVGFLDLPLLGKIRRDAMGSNGVVAADGRLLDDVDLEAFRILRANIEFLCADGAARVVLVTSAVPEEGKSTVAAGLANASAMASRRTLLVECDLRRPSLGPRLGLEAGPGLADFLTGQTTAPVVVRRPTSVSSANGKYAQPAGASEDCVLAGAPGPMPSTLLRSPRLGDFLQDARRDYDLIILDSAPLLPVVDTVELFAWVDAAVLCVRQGQTTRDQARAARDILGHLGDRPRGLVVTNVGNETQGYYGNYYASYGNRVEPTSLTQRVQADV